MAAASGRHPGPVRAGRGLAAGCSSKPAYCTDAANLKTSVSNLGNVNVATNGLGSLQTALSRSAWPSCA